MTGYNLNNPFFRSILSFQWIGVNQSAANPKTAKAKPWVDAFL
jgi:hypothetical protein